MNGLYLFTKKFTSNLRTILAGLTIIALIVPQTVFALAITPQTVIELTNTERTKYNESTLTANIELTLAANAKAQNMLEYGYFDHFGPNGETPWQYILDHNYDYEFAGENLAMNFFQAESVVKAWMASATHRDNILDPDFKEIGIAVLEGEIEGEKTTLVVQMFGAKQPTLTESLTPSTPLVKYVGELLGINEQ